MLLRHPHMNRLIVSHNSYLLISRSVGYTEWNVLFTKPNDYDKKSVIPYKSSMRQKIQEMRYKIIVNIGDRFSDLAGGHAERVFKLPNPYYFIP
jgi:hypothetical protein